MAESSEKEIKTVSYEEQTSDDSAAENEDEQSKETKEIVIQKESTILINTIKATNELLITKSVSAETLRRSKKIWLLIRGNWSLLVIIVSVIIGVYIYNNQNCKPNGSQLTSDNISPVDAFQIKLLKEIKTLKHSFPGQLNDSWINMMAAFNSVSIEEPSQPAVLLLISPNTQEGIQTMSCLSKKTAVAINRLFGRSMENEPVIQSEEIVNFQKTVDPIKKELIKRMNSVLENSSSVVLTHLEILPPEAVIILHGFCDNFMAPFKKSIIILTITFNPDDHKLDNPSQVDRLLHRLWASDLGTDLSASLVSRMANFPVLVQPESGISCP